MAPNIHRHYRRLMFHHELARLTGSEIKDTGSAVRGSGAQCLAIGRKAEASDRPGVFDRLAELLFEVAIVDAHFAIRITEGEPTVILANRARGKSAVVITPFFHRRSVG